jgi:predicted nuclease with TOPRIM domain
MGRKKGTDDEVEKLEQEINRLKSENRHLHKELKRSNKKYKPEHEQEDLIKEDHKEKLNICDNCGKGKLAIVELGPRKLVSCTVCEYRKTLKNG